MQTTRRAILGASALIPAAALLGCASQTTTQLQTDVQTLATGVSGIVSALQALPSNPVPAATIAQVQTAITDIQTNAASIASALTPNTSVLQTISQAVATLSALATPFFPAAPAVAAVVQAAVALMSVILTEAGVASATLRLPAPTMSAAQARLILRAAVK